jgi:hypothetical protein
MTDEMKTLFDTKFHMFFLHYSQIMKAIPWTTAQETYGLEYYVPVALPPPAEGMKYAHHKLVEVQYEKLTNPPVGLWYDLEINDVDLKLLLNTEGMAISNSWAQLAATQMNQKIAYAMYNGSTATGMSGLIAKAGNNSTYASAIQTAPNFLSLAQNMKGLIFADGFKPPYVFIQSTGMQVAWDTTINSTPVSEITQGDAIRRVFSTMNDGQTSGDAKIYWETNGASSGTTINPLPAADNDDGVALLLKPIQDGNIAHTGVWCQPMTSTDWKFDTKSNRWHTRIKCKVGLAVYDADSICKHTDIDYS